MMKRWQDFLDSLSTRGGNIFVLTVIFSVMAGLVLHVLHHGSDSSSPIATVLISTFSGFSGALLTMLSGNASKQQMVDRALSSGTIPEPPPTAAPQETK